jgi:hypothetical protein
MTDEIARRDGAAVANRTATTTAKTFAIIVSWTKTISVPVDSPAPW